MSRSFAPGLKASETALIRKIRELPIRGDVVCKVGDEVSAEQVVARTELKGEMRILRVADELGIPPADMSRVLKVAVGSTLAAGELVAEIQGFFGLFRHRVISPISGVVEFMSETTGHLGIRAQPRLLELSAYISGKVVDVVDGRSVTIESSGTFVQGIFGVGGERLGKIKILNVQSDQELRARHIGADCAGQILVGGCSVGSDAIRAAIKANAVGLITASIDDVTLREFVGYDIGVAVTGDEDLPMTLIITEGFGRMPMSDRVLTILKKCDGKVCSINGATQVRAGALRPEVIVTSDVHAGEMPVDEDGALVVGGRIRCIRVPYFGELGVVTELPQAQHRIETGALTRVLRAKLDRGDEVVVPRANVERV